MTRLENKFLKKTNLNAIKRAAKNFLYIDPVTDSKIPCFCYHPFFQNTYFPDVINNRMLNIEIAEDLEYLRKILLESINDATDVYGIWWLINKSYFLVVFKYISKYLSEKDYSNILKESYTMTEFPNYNTVNVTVAELKELFKLPSKNIFMDEEELEVYNNLPETVTVYRGSEYSKYYKALSWTTDLQTAKFFANRFNRKDSEPTIYKATIDKKFVIAYFSNEYEIIVDYDKLILEEPIYL